MFQSIVFNCDDKEPIRKAVAFLRSQMAANRSQKYYPIPDVPLDFIPKSLRIHVIARFADQKDKRRKIGMVNANRYEYMVYLQLNKMLDSGQVYIHDTINYRRLEDDLIPYEYWLANREKILSQLNLPILNQPIKQILEDLDKSLVERYHAVNRNIKNGDNKHIKLEKNRNKEVTWRLPYRRQEDAVNNPFYENFTNINIGDVIRYVIEETQFDKKFKHIQPYYSKTSAETNNLIAVLIANGAGFGISRMADISDMNLRVNFALMYLFGYRFMPRFVHLPEKAQKNLVSFQNPSKYENYIIKPKNKVDEGLIVQEWDNILRILASLAMKETTQSVVVRKLSSYRRTNPTLKALIEFDKIIMSLYMLDYVDDPDMRSNVHRSLNRGEALHQLISAIRKITDKKLLGKNELEMDINNECTRLIANCIIYYNATLLSDLYDTCANDDHQAFCDLIKRLSPVAWQHINLIGKYEFCKNQIAINIQEVIETVLLNSEINFGSQMQT